MESAFEPESKVTIAHALAGRTRLRIAGFRLGAELANTLANTLVARPGIEQVEVDARTGSVLCSHAQPLAAEAVLEIVRNAVRELRPAAGAESPRLPSTRLARELARLFHDANRDLLAATEGRLDLGTAATLTFLGAGALEVLVRRQIAAPRWFNLAWWGFRTFMTFEGAAIQHDRQNKGGTDDREQE